MIVQVKVNDVERNVEPPSSFRLESRLSNKVSTAKFDITGAAPSAKQEVAINRTEDPMLNCAVANVVAFGGRSKWLDNFFGGNIASIEHRKIGITNVYRCTAQDYNIVLHSIMVNETYAAKTEAFIIEDLFSTYWNDIDTTTYVTGTETMTIGFPRLLLDGCLDQLARINGREWYIDYDKKLHYFTPVTTEAPFGFHDSSFSSIKLPYHGLNYKEDATRIINRVTVVGDTGVPVVVTRTDAPSFAKFGRYFDAKIVDYNIDTEAWAELVGDALLAQFADTRISGWLNCNQEGLKVGQKAKLVNSQYSLDAFYLIQSIVLSIVGGDVEDVRVEFGDYSPDLTVLLGKIQQLEAKE